MAGRGFLARHGIVRSAIREDVLFFGLPGFLVFVLGLIVSARDGYPLSTMAAVIMPRFRTGGRPKLAGPVQPAESRRKRGGKSLNHYRVPRIPPRTRAPAARLGRRVESRH